MTQFSLADLEAIVAGRAASTAEKSYTKSLLDAGVARCAKKFGEESIEAVIAAMEPDRAAFVGEAADVVFHLLVLLRARGVAVADVLAELERRAAQSGHAEKAARTGSPP